MKQSVILIDSRVLGGNVKDVESFYDHVTSVPTAEQYVFDMRGVTWVKPYGVNALVLAARLLANRSGRPVLLVNLVEQVHLYLNRMNVVDAHDNWFLASTQLDEAWFRNPQTPNLLELTTIEGPVDVEAAVTRARQVFSQWLPQSELYSLLHVISELCANIYQHSGDQQGSILIQTNRFPTQGVRAVCLTVGDLGCGIRGSIVRRHGQLGDDPLDYLHEALKGRSARNTGRGGLGLRTAAQIAHTSGGYLWLRSETAAVLCQGLNNLQPNRNLPLIPGTQVTVELKALLI